MKRAGRKARLNDDHRVGEGDEDAIAGEKRAAWRGTGPEQPDHRAGAGANHIEKFSVIRWIAPIRSCPRDHPCPSTGMDRSSMRGGVDAQRPSGHHDYAGPNQGSAKPFGEANRAAGRVAGAHHGDRVLGLQASAPKKDAGRRSGILTQARGIGWIEPRDFAQSRHSALSASVPATLPIARGVPPRGPRGCFGPRESHCR